MTLKKGFSDQLPHIPSRNILYNRTLHFSEQCKESRSLTIAALLLQLLLFIPIFLLCARDTDHEPIYDFNMTKSLVNEHINKAENMFKTFLRKPNIELTKRFKVNNISQNTKYKETYNY